MYLAITRAKYFLLLLCFGFASICQAIGFGELKLYSYLGEQLYAEISLTGYEGMDPQMMQVNLANAKDFMRAGIDRPYFLTSLAFQIVTTENQMLVVVRTSKPVQIPFLEFLIELSWPGGNLIKEYTILLDPPPADFQPDTRPKGIAQQADEAAKAQDLSTNPIEQQMDLQVAKQQKQEAEAILKNVVQEGSNKFSDNTFEVDAAKSLVPGVVPDVTDQTNEYRKQRQAFVDSQAAKAKPAPATLLQKVVSGIEEAKQADDQYDLSVKDILAEEQQAAAQPSTSANTSTPSTKSADPNKPVEGPVDFNEVIKPSQKKQGDSAAITPATTPGPVLTPPAQTEPKKSGNHLYLGIILSLLLIAAGIVIAIKRGLLKAIIHKHQSASSDANADATIAAETIVTETSTTATTENTAANVVIPQEHAGIDTDAPKDAKEFAADVEQFVASDEDAEQIELAAVQSAVAEEVSQNSIKNGSEQDLSEFEEEFASINLDELGMPVEPETQPAAVAAAEPETPPVAVTAAEPETPPAPVAAAEPETPAAPVTDAEPETPAALVPAAEPETPSAPVTDAEPETPAAPVTDAEPETPAAPVPAAEPETPAAPNTDSANSAVTGPTLVNEAGFGLRLSEEGAILSSPVQSSRILDNSDEVSKKLKLAKTYIDTGDRDSAKDLLQEILEIANDEQKLEAQLLLQTLQ